MKTLILLAVLGAGLWFLMSKAKQSATVRQIQQEPERYAKSLKSDVDRAKKAAERANESIQKTVSDVQKAVDADR